MKKKILIVVITLAFLGFFFLNENGHNIETDAPKLKYKTVRVQRGNLELKISATGIVEPDSQVEVKSKASGEILKFPFEEGDFIKKGKLLLRLDKSDEQRNVNKALADLQSASAKLKNAITNIKLQKTKYSKSQEKKKTKKEKKNRKQETATTAKIELQSTLPSDTDR